MSIEHLTELAAGLHENVNHLYDGKPYRFHLQMVSKVAHRYDYLIKDSSNWYNVKIACWFHDTIEDTRVSYNDLKDIIGQEAADIVYALTNEKGRNRSERANAKYYEGINNTPYAVFVKLCDRIANVLYSKYCASGTNMYHKYKMENESFLSYLNTTGLEQMVEELINLFK